MGMKAGDVVPESCDCCGHDAEDCGMLENGWVSDAQFLAGGGVYCRACAHLLRLVRLEEECVWCDEPMVEEEAAEARGWVYYADEFGSLHPCCPACLARRFGITARVSLGRDG
ncbi:hypothetical protein [Gaiella sp.]|uniref:hypothetical protein n=1 Tax=Gaiella sp. TaxID=2663207 RepID=UPI0032670FE4